MSVKVSIDTKGAEQFSTTIVKLDSGMQRHVRSQLASWATDVKALAERIVPVRTGHLRSSLYVRVQGWVAEVGAEAAYAMFVEFGTRYMRARPYLYPSVQHYLPRLEAVISEAIENAKLEAGL